MCYFFTQSWILIRLLCKHVKAHVGLLPRKTPEFPCLTENAYLSNIVKELGWLAVFHALSSQTLEMYQKKSFCTMFYHLVLTLTLELFSCYIIVCNLYINSRKLWKGWPLLVSSRFMIIHLPTIRNVSALNM